MALLYGFESTAFHAAVAAAKKYREELIKKPGVVGVRAGYRVVNQWVTTTPAVVVSVNRKKLPSELSEADRVPSHLDGVPTDLAPASAKEIRAAEKKARDEASKGEATEAPADGAAHAVTEPGIFDDVTLDESAPLVGKSAETLAADTAEGTLYKRPTGLTLEKVPAAPGEVLDVFCHAGPDASWPTLSKFLGATKGRLNVAMYDFKAQHILQALRKAKPGRLEIIIDPGLGPEETAAINQLQEDPDIKDGFDLVLASVSNKKGKEGVFASAYHTKVAVRDSEAMWLSSGNWSASSQPNVDPFDPSTPATGLHKRSNREYHVVIPHPGLSQTMEKYIAWDREQSLKHPTHTLKSGGGNDEQGAADDASSLAAAVRNTRPDLLIPRAAYDAFFAESAAGADEPPPRFFEPEWIQLRQEAGDYTLPLLTQDNYIEEMTRLVAGAKEKLYLQFQYIRLRGDTPVRFREVLLMLKKKIDEKLDVRVIIGHNDVRRDLENLVGVELDISRFKVQVNCHNKTLLADDRYVVVGSHNWSGDGTTRNRDASLLFQSEAVYDYYERIFLHDWSRLAAQNINEGLVPVPVEADAPTPDDMIRLNWFDVFDE